MYLCRVGGRGSGTKEDVGLMTPAKHMPQGQYRTKI